MPRSPEPGHTKHPGLGRPQATLGGTCQGSVWLVLGVRAGGLGVADTWCSGMCVASSTPRSLRVRHVHRVMVSAEPPATLVLSPPPENGPTRLLPSCALVSAAARGPAGLTGKRATTGTSPLLHTAGDIAWLGPLTPLSSGPTLHCTVASPTLSGPSQLSTWSCRSAAPLAFSVAGRSVGQNRCSA